MNEMLKALNLIAHRIEEAKRSFHNSQLWDEEECYWAVGKTYQQEIDAAFIEAWELAKKLYSERPADDPRRISDN